MVASVLVHAALAYSLHLAPAVAPTAAAAVRRSRDAMLVAGLSVEGETPKTVGEAKDNFFAAYNRPVNSMQQQFVSELLTAGTFAYVKAGYKPTRAFYLGFVTLCDTFLAGVPSDAERDKIYTSLCAGLALDKEKVREEAEALKAFATGKTEEELFAGEDLSFLAESGISYSYPLGSGLITLMPLVGVEPTEESIARWCGALFAKAPTPPGKTMFKDYKQFVDAQEKLEQMKAMFLEMAAASKRKEAKALAEKAEAAAKEAAEAEAAA